MNTLVIIPAYNEQDSLEHTISMLTSQLGDISYLIVNDGSTDKTECVCKQNNYHYISLPVNTGLSGAFQAGMKYADRHGFDAAVQFDADGQHVPEYIPVMQHALISEGADVVIASRYKNGTKPQGARGLGSRLISWLIRITAHQTITDPTSGMRMFNKRLIHAYATGFDITPEPDTIALFARKGAKIIEIPAHMQERQAGESYFNLPSILLYMSRTCLSLVLFQWFR